MSNVLTEISDSSFDTDVTSAKTPVLVDFWAPWCGPCKAIAPALEALSEKYAGKVKIVKLNVDNNPATPPKFGVRSIPTLILFKEGQVLATQVGSVSQAELGAFLDTHL